MDAPSAPSSSNTIHPPAAGLRLGKGPVALLGAFLFTTLGAPSVEAACICQGNCEVSAGALIQGCEEGGWVQGYANVKIPGSDTILLESDSSVKANLSPGVYLLTASATGGCITGSYWVEVDATLTCKGGCDTETMTTHYWAVGGFEKLVTLKVTEPSLKDEFGKASPPENSVPQTSDVPLDQPGPPDPPANFEQELGLGVDPATAQPVGRLKIKADATGYTGAIEVGDLLVHPYSSDSSLVIRNDAGSGKLRQVDSPAGLLDVQEVTGSDCASSRGAALLRRIRSQACAPSPARRRPLPPSMSSPGTVSRAMSAPCPRRTGWSRFMSCRVPSRAMMRSGRCGRGTNAPR